MWYSSDAGTSGTAIIYGLYSSPTTIPGGTYSSGLTLTHYRAMGIPGYSIDGTHVVRGDVCTENYYLCGMETVDVAT